MLNPERIRALLWTRGGLWAAVTPLLAGVACAFLPLADHLGFEFALVLAIASSLSAPALGVAAIRLEVEKPEPDRRPVRAALVACGVAVLALLGPAALILLNALRRPACEPGSGALWLLVLPMPSALLAAAVGALARVRGGSAKGAAWRVAVVELVSLGLGLWSIYAGPAFFLFDHFFGYFPGPLYDETVLLGPTVLAFRAFTLAWAAAAVLGCGLLDADPARARQYGTAAILLALVTALGSLRFGERIGFRTSDGSLAQALGGVRETKQLTIRYPREWNEETVDQLVRDASFQAERVTEVLGIKDAARVQVWMYRSADEKRQLVGAAATSFAKPWRREVHVHAMAFPHPVLRHELVHAFAADFARGPFHVPGGLFPNSPLIEGFAVAHEAEPEGMTLMQWARAMRAMGLAPDVTALFSTQGFMSAAPARAYTYAGAFIRHLRETRGQAAVTELYRSGDLSRLGDPAALLHEFEAALDRERIGPEEKAAAQRRYARPSVFRRRCAREVSAIIEAAARALQANDPAAATGLYEQACAMEPDDPALLRNQLTAAIRARDDARRDEVTRRLLSHEKLDPSLRAAVLTELGDQAWRTGAAGVARDRYAEAAKLDADPATHRGAVARLLAVATPERAGVIAPLLLDGQTEAGVLFALNDHLVRAPEDRLVAYLLGRQLVQKGAFERGARLLQTCAGLLGDRELDREARRLVIRAWAEARRCDSVTVAARDVPAEDAVDRAWAEDWAARCRFEHGLGATKRPSDR